MPGRGTSDTTIGDRIRARRLLRGWSVRYAASRAGISHATWSRIERGRQAADNRFMLADIAAALECSLIGLTGTPVPAADRRALTAAANTYAIRQALIDIDLTEPSFRPVRPVAALEGETSLVRALWCGGDYAGAARLLPALLRDLHAAARGRDRARILHLFCAATDVTQAIARNIGYPAEAWLAAERGRDAAEAAEDPVLLGYAAFSRGQVTTTCGSFARCLTLADRAADRLQPHLARPGALTVLGMLRLLGACAGMGLARPADSATRLAEAADIAARTGETTTLGLFFGPTNVSFWRIGMETDGGEPGRAVEIAQRTNPGVIDAKIRQVYFHRDVALAYTRLRGKDREAVRHLLIAERIAPQHVHTSALVQETARALLERSQRQAGGTELRGLCERMGLAG